MAPALIDPDNAVIQLCAKGIELEGSAKPEQAALLFEQAWSAAVTPFEKLCSAHYLARHQNTIGQKLRWDERALELAFQCGSLEIKTFYPSLFLNVGKCYEDLDQPDRALANYLSGLVYCAHLSDDGYGRMISAGIRAGIDRVTTASFL